jgi:ubiquinone/menaquinone biosynthesis C-methylase UbiE
MPEDHMNKLYTSKNIFVSFVHNQRLDQIVRHVPSGRDGMRILDAGCGEGHLIDRLYKRCSRNAYYGADITDIALKKAAERCPYAELMKGDLTGLDYESGFFDAVLCTEVLEHIHDYPAVLGEFSRVLKEGGLLILTFPNETLWMLGRLLLGRRPLRVPDHVNSFNPRMISGATKLKLVSRKNLPFGLPFRMSLGCLMKLQK